MGGVVGERARASIAAAHELRVDEEAVVTAVDVGQEPAIAVARVAVESQRDDAARDQARVVGRRPPRPAADTHARLDVLGRVHPDVAQALDAAVECDLDRVAVDDAHDTRVLGALRPGSPSQRAQADQRGQRKEHGEQGQGARGPHRR
jgi:hypothetical protein